MHFKAPPIASPDPHLGPREASLGGAGPIQAGRWGMARKNRNWKPLKKTGGKPWKTAENHRIPGTRI